MGNSCSNDAAVVMPPSKAKPKKYAYSDRPRKNKHKTKKTLQDTFYSQIPQVHGPGRDVFSYYEKVQEIAEGSTCNIWTVRKTACCEMRRASSSFSLDDSSQRSSQDRLYALKAISEDLLTNKVFLEEMKNEIELLRSLDHPNIVRVYDMFEDVRREKMYIVMEYCSGGDLYSRFPYTESQAAHIVSHILSALAYMHKRGVAHRDLKLENVIFASPKPNNNQVKLIDFGLAKKYLYPNKRKLSTMTEKVGTVYTMAPEVINGPSYTAKADCWSIGVIAYMLLSDNQLPFDGKTKKAIANKIVKGKYAFHGKRWKTVSREARDFVASLLVYDHQQRKTAIEALQSPWLQRHRALSPAGSNNGACDDNENDLMESVSSAVISSSQDSKLKKMALMVIAYKSNLEDIQRLREAFDRYDSKGDGVITYSEFRDAMMQEECNLTDEDVRSLFQSIDMNETGTIDYTEFLAVTLETRGRIENEEIAEAFDRFDADCTGYISKENLCEILGNKCKRNCDETIQEIMSEVDVDRDNRISYQEFLSVFRERQRDTVEEACCKLSPLKSNVCSCSKEN